MNRAILSVIAAGLVLVATSAAFATPFLDYTEADAGDGLTQYTVFVDTDDGLLLSVFLELSFTGPFNEILSFSTDAPDDNPLFLNDPNYAANQGKDSFFFVEDNFKTGLVGQFFTIDHADANTYNIRAGQGGGSELLRFPLAQFVMPTPAGPADWVSYSGVLARTGANFDVAGTILIPEPGTFLMAALGLAGLVAFERRTRRSC